MGGLIHNILNTLMVLEHRVAQLRLASGQSAEASATVAGQLQSGLHQVGAVLRLVQSISRSHYAGHAPAASGSTRLIEETIEDRRSQSPGIDYSLRIEPGVDDSTLPVGVLAFVVGELLDNAARACGNGSRPAIALAVGELSLECRDNGPGLPQAVLDAVSAGRLRPAKSGAGGFGLYLIQEIAQRLGGTLLAVNDGGARVTVLLPGRLE